MQRCTQCKCEKSIEQFHWIGSRNRRASSCKTCTNARSRAWKTKKKKTCAEWIQNVRIIDRVRSKIRYTKQKDLLQQYFKQRYINNKAKVRAINENWRSRNMDKNREAARRRYARDPLGAVRCAERRAKRLRSQPTWLTLIQRAQIKEMYEIARAKKIQTGVPHEVDHIVPLLNEAVCGLHVPWNLRVITRNQNRSKSHRFVESA